MKLTVREWTFQVQSYLPADPDRGRLCRLIQRRTLNKAYDAPIAIRLSKAERVLVERALERAAETRIRAPLYTRRTMPEGFKER